MRIFHSSFFTKLTLAASATAVLVSCDDPEYPTPVPATTSTVSQSQARIVNAAPGATTTAALIDNVAFGSSLPYLGTIATPVSAGQRLFLFNEPTNIPTNATPPAAPRTVALRSAFLGGNNYTVFLTDQPNRAIPANQTTDQGGIRTLVLTDNLAAPTGANNAKIRFVNLSQSGTYGIFNAAGASLFTAAPTRAYRGLTTGTGASLVTFSNFTEVAAGTYGLNVRSAATTPIAGTAQEFTFAAGKIYTLYVRGLAGSGSSTTALGISSVQHN